MAKVEEPVPPSEEELSEKAAARAEMAVAPALVATSLPDYLRAYFARVRAGKTPPSGLVNGTTHDSQANADVQSVLLTPIWVTTQNMESTVVKDGFRTASDICIATIASECTAAGIS